jgi:MFS family permease
LQALLPIYAGVDRGLSGAEVGLLFGIIGVVNLAMIAPVGYISDKVGRKAATIPTAALAGIAYLLYPFAETFLALAALSVILGIATGFGLGSMTIYTYDLAPASGRGMVQSVRRIAGDVGGLSGPVVGGFLAITFSTGLAFLLVSPLHILSALLLTFVARESLHRPPREPAA